MSLRKRTPLFIIIVFIIVFFLARLPYYPSPLTYEEGIHANIFYTSPANPNYLQIGRIDGKDILAVPQHPAILYEILGFVGSIWRFLFNYQNLGKTELTVLIRYAISTIQFVSFLLILIVFFAQKKKKLDNLVLSSLAIIIIAASVPVIAMSISVQIDGSSGIFLTGLFSIALLCYAFQLFPKIINNILLLIGSVCFGFGKNEWSIALLTTIIVTSAFILVPSLRKKIQYDNSSLWKVLGIIALGLLLGNVISYCYDSYNYLAGLSVMFRISKGSTFLNIRTMIGRLRFTYVNVILLCTLFIALVKSFKNMNFYLLFLFLFSLMMFSAYFAISWGSDIRYYSSSIIIAVVGLPFALNEFRANQFKVIFICISVFLILLSSGSIYHNRTNLLQYSSLNQMSPANNEILKDNSHCIPFMDAGEAFGTKSDFISNSLSKNDAISIADEYGKELCE